ncbi:RHS repeat-associated core domain-containing protein [Pseudomonas sp. CCOS 191]|uniref:RHS repeat-associated core domain-containing protein n=1 Tax=Pseudomonas sp. CCOS 191 TaxID=1649877 RepID=UPI0006243AD8|nr:RHS repeat-associated core domain-containing protein [Pseudomonas sp. CCOS 191]CRI58242.1 hypothetical protein CCOS191_3706 [Pseudomonas sp. CCOS 191]
MSARNAYSPYGYRGTQPASTGALGFNGQFFHAELECYALGNGHRIYSPRLMRFASPDALSPFHKGGINAYAYCLNDPVNARDPSGKVVEFMYKLARPTMRWVANAYQSPAAPLKLLKNNQSHLLGPEVMYAQAEIKAARASLRIMNTPNSFAQLDENQVHKLVVTKNDELVALSGQTNETIPSHAAAGELSGHGYGVKGNGEELMSAGELTISKETDGTRVYTLTNQSGHFHPDLARLHIMAERVRRVGVSVKLAPINIDFDM